MTSRNREKGSSSSSASSLALKMGHDDICRQQLLDYRPGRTGGRRRLRRTRPSSSATATAILVLAAAAAAISPFLLLLVEAQSSSNLCGALTCLNNATCKTSNGGNNNGGAGGGEYCDCPAGFADVDCGRLVRECHYVTGDRSITAECYNGGVCLPELSIVHHDSNNNNNNANKEDAASPLCDCSAAIYKSQRYVGKYCEMPLDDKSMCRGSGSSSSSSPTTTTTAEDDLTIMDRHFCLHGGTCVENDSSIDDSTGTGSPSCNCAAGFRGPHCEFTMQYDPACTLKCENGGVCSFGGGGGGGSSSSIQSGGHATTWGSHGEQHCQCPAGFAGVQCEHVVNVCNIPNAIVNNYNKSGHLVNTGGNVCLHGSTCDYTSINVDEKSGRTSYACACPADANKYLGGTCKGGGGGGEQQQQHRRMELCNPSTPGVAEFAFGMAVAAFCVNGGTCKDVVVENTQVLLGCDCPPLFEGPHCEHLKTAAQINGALQQPSDNDGKGASAGKAFGIFVATLVALIGGFFVWRQWRRCRRAKRANRNQSFNGAAILNLQGFRDHASFRDEVVVPPVPPSPERTGSSSTTGPAVSFSSNDDEEEEEEQQERSFSSSSNDDEEEEEEQQERSFAVGELLHDVTIN